MQQKNRVSVKIADVDYLITGEETQEHLQKCAEIVDERIRQIAKSNFALSDTMVAVLAACNIADDYLNLEVKAQNVIDMETENARLKEENAYLLKELAKLRNRQVRDNSRQKE